MDLIDEAPAAVAVRQELGSAVVRFAGDSGRPVLTAAEGRDTLRGRPVRHRR